jgi:hypothetical protein
MPRPAAKKRIAPIPTSVAMADLPCIGAPLAGGQFAGIARGEKGKPDNAIVVLIDEPKALTWKAALAWAEKLNASLPTRAEARICYANLRDAFEADWYWTCEQYAGDESSAWCQDFGLGNQDDTRKDGELRARAVRRLPIQ